MVKARDLTKKFGPVMALDDLTIAIEPAEFVFLTGPSGSGKTTFLRLLTRELKPDSGELTVNNQDLIKLPLNQLPTFRRGIGMVYQDFKLLSDSNVGENVALPLSVRGMASTDIDSAVKLALAMVDLSDKAHLFPAQLSGGELQRVGLARAIVGKPNLLLADEPTGNLDPKTAQSIVKLIKEIHQHLKTTVIMATHNSEIVNRYNLRVIALNAGRKVKDSPSGKYD